MAYHTLIDIGGHRNNVLQEHLQGYWIFDNLPQPDIQTPQLIAFFGSFTKRRVARHLFSVQSCIPDKILVYGLSGLKATSPLMLIDCELHNARASTTSTSGTVLQHPLKWYNSFGSDLVSVANLAYSKLVVQFSTICGIFAKDYGGLAAVALVITNWMRALRTRAPEIHCSAYSKILIFVEQEDQTGFDERLATADFLVRLRKIIEEEKELFRYLRIQHLTNSEFEKLLMNKFFEIKVLPLPTATRGEVRKQLDTLRSRIAQESQDVHDLRKAAGLAFNARHLKSLFGLACAHLSENIVKPFSVMQASRKANPVPQGFIAGISEFLKAVPETAKSMIGPIIASSLILDSYPPGSHAFDLKTCYELLYSGVILNVLQKLSMPCLEDGIKEHFTTTTSLSNTAFSHLQILRNYSAEWKKIYSSTTCFACLIVPPDGGRMVRLACKHFICENCIVIHGKSSLEESWDITLDSCLLCMISTKTMVSLKPSTAGVRALAIDGGSKPDFDVLQMIEKSIGLPVDIERHFDVVHASGQGVWEMIRRFFKADQTPDDTHKLQKINQALYHNIHPSTSRFSVSTRSSTVIRPALKRINGALGTFPRWSENMQSSMVVISSLATIFDGIILENAGGAHKIGVLASRPKSTSIHVLSNYKSDTPQRCPTLAQCARMSLLQKSVHGYQTHRCSHPKEIIDTIHKAQNDVWERAGRTTDVLIALGAHTPLYDQPRLNVIYPNLIDYRLGFSSNRLTDTRDMILASLFYIELMGPPQPNELQHFSCKIQIRCRLSPSSSGYQALISKLQKQRSRFYFDYQSIPCINHEIYDESKRGIAFSRRFEVSATSMSAAIDIRVDGITSACRSISNCPYELRQLVKDQKLDCIFGSKDHKLRYFGSLPSTRAI